MGSVAQNYEVRDVIVNLYIIIAIFGTYSINYKFFMLSFSDPLHCLSSKFGPITDYCHECPVGLTVVRHDLNTHAEDLEFQEHDATLQF